MEYLKMFITQDKRLLYLDCKRFSPDAIRRQYLPSWMTYVPLSTFPLKAYPHSGVYTA